MNLNLSEEKLLMLLNCTQLFLSQKDLVISYSEILRYKQLEEELQEALTNFYLIENANKKQIQSGDYVQLNNKCPNILKISICDNKKYLVSEYQKDCNICYILDDDGDEIGISADYFDLIEG